jgi:DNA (cytosine-5)-methyltransferase 1
VNYYNEFDAKAAAWLRELIKAGCIPPGDVDERSIVDVRPSDLAGYTQCHFFAGIGGWSYALGLAGWDASRPVWTGSCPCQSFSTAGKGKGGNDQERHLWPHWFGLIRECRPPVIFGEQVEAAVAHGWLDAVFADLEAQDYACAAAVLGAHSVGAPHIRQRLYFVAQNPSCVGRRGRSNGDSSRDNGALQAQGRSAPRLLADAAGGSRGGERPQHDQHGLLEAGRDAHGPAGQPERAEAPGQLEHSAGGRRQGREPQLAGQPAEVPREGCGQLGLMGDASLGGQRVCGGASGDAGRVAQPGKDGGVADPDGGRLEELRGSEPVAATDARQAPEDPSQLRGDVSLPGPVNGFWGASDWIFCRDGKWRPVKPGTFPLAHGVPARVGRLRGYGNAIVPQVAAEFIMAYGCPQHRQEKEEKRG